MGYKKEQVKQQNKYACNKNNNNPMSKRWAFRVNQLLSWFLCRFSSALVASFRLPSPSVCSSQRGLCSSRRLLAASIAYWAKTCNGIRRKRRDWPVSPRESSEQPTGTSMDQHQHLITWFKPMDLFNKGRTCTFAIMQYSNQLHSSFRSDQEEPCRPTGCSMQEKNETEKGNNMETMVQSGFTLSLCSFKNGWLCWPGLNHPYLISWLQPILSLFQISCTEQ